MNGSGAPGNRRRAASRSPPCSSGSSAPPMGTMSVALALIAMLIELCFGYPERVAAARSAIRSTWIGRLIGALDRLLNRETAGASARRAAGIVAVLILIVVVGAVAFDRRARASAPSLRSPRRWPPRQHADRATKPAPARGGCRRCAGEARHRRRPHRSVAHRRPRYRGARCSRRRPRGDREPRREFLRCAWSRRSSGWPLPDSLAPHSTRRSTPPTV